MKGRIERISNWRESREVQVIPVTFNTEAKVSVFVYPSILGTGEIVFLRP